MGSPASGDSKRHQSRYPGVIEFPFNWDPQRVGTIDLHLPNRATEFQVSIQLGSPASGDENIKLEGYKTLREVSIQLGSPASGDWTLSQYQVRATARVSIQLGSPASGDLLCRERSGQIFIVSIQLGSPASGDAHYETDWGLLECFHSIGIPSEWGPGQLRRSRDHRGVSIQLGSPASGDWKVES